MRKRLLRLALMLLVAVAAAPALADEYDDTIKLFRTSGPSGGFFKSAYGYAVFPSIGKGAVGIGGGYGSGRVYIKGAHVGDTSMTQLSVGFALGGETYRQIIFFENKSAFDQFSTGNFEFGANASAVAITSSASAQTSTGGGSGAAVSSGGDKQTKTAGGAYQSGVATFIVVKGGLMHDVSLGGQKYSYTPKKPDAKKGDAKKAEKK
jgi:hypothetical protein